jgi:very-short-patch-repair endonuclease
MGRMKNIRFNPRLKELARHLRKNSTLAEVLLWNVLKRRNVKGYRFNRQKPIDEFIVDFYCHELKVVIEIDGVTHDWNVKKDMMRQKKLETLGITVLRFLDSDVRDNMEGVLLSIGEWIDLWERRNQ